MIFANQKENWGKIFRFDNIFYSQRFTIKTKAILEIRILARIRRISNA